VKRWIRGAEKSKGKEKRFPDGAWAIGSSEEGDQGRGGEQRLGGAGAMGAVKRGRITVEGEHRNRGEGEQKGWAAGAREGKKKEQGGRGAVAV
jgi:hypothetical protein